MINGCGIDYKSNIRYDCVFYHCEQDMGASIDCCTLRGLGDCPCSDKCKDYANIGEIYRLGLETFKHKKTPEENYKEIILFLLDELEWHHPGIKDSYLNGIKNKYNIDF